MLVSALPNCTAATYFLSDYRGLLQFSPSKSVLLDPTGAATPLPALTMPVLLAACADNGTVYFSDETGRGLWHFNVNSPSSQPTPIHTFDQETYGVAYDAKKDVVFVATYSAFSTGSIYMVPTDGGQVNKVTDTGLSYGLATHDSKS